MNKHMSLTEGSITKGLILFAVPILLSNLFQQLYNSVDSMVVGNYVGSAALAAVGSTGSLINLLIGFFLGIATGTGVLYAMHYGAEDYPGLKKLIDCAMVLSVGVGVVISVLGIAFSRQMLIWMDTPDDVLDPANQYLRIYLAGTIITLIYNVGAGMLRAEGDSTRPLIYLVIGGVTNLILDLLLVAVFDMGVAGAAIATVAAQLVSAVLTVIRLTKLDARYRFRPLRMELNALTMWDIIRISVPCGLQSSMFNIANLLVQAKINSFGTAAMAGITAYTKLDGFIYMPMNAMALAVSTYVGQNIGAGRFSRIRKGIRVAILSSLGATLVLEAAVFLFSAPLLDLFTDEPDAKTYALQMMLYLAPCNWLFVPSDVLGGAIRGAGQAMKVTIISAVCICVFRVIWLIVTLHFDHDIRYVFLCYPTSWLLSSAAMGIFYFKSAVIRKTLQSQDTPAIAE